VAHEESIAGTHARKNPPALLHGHRRVSFTSKAPDPSSAPIRTKDLARTGRALKNKSTGKTPVLTMKKILTVLILAAATAAAIAQIAPPVNEPKIGATAPASLDPAVVAITKERDDAKAALAAAQTQQQQQAVVTEYYKAVAERNEAILRLTQANAQIADLQAKLAAATAPKPPAK
jgi:hypothetical protein